MIEEPINEAALLMLTATGLSQTTLYGDVEELMTWPGTKK